MSAYKPLYTVDEASQALGVSSATVRRLAKSKYIQQRYVGAKMLLTGSSIETFVDNLPELPNPRFWE